MTTTLDPTRPDTGPTRPRPTRHALVAVVAVGVVCGEVLLRPSAGLGMAVALVGLTWVATVGPTSRWRPDGWLPVVSVGVLAMWLPLRASPWVTAPIIIACLALVTLAGSARHFGDLVSRGRFHWCERLVDQVATLVPSSAERTRISERRQHGLLTTLSTDRLVPASFAAIVFIVMIALLRSGDAVFDSLATSALDGVVFGRVLLHVIVIGFGLLTTGGLALAAAGTASVGASSTNVTPTRPVDATILLGATATALAVFAITQIITLARGGDWVRSRTGLTYAEYARQGFFQLIAVAVIVVAVLLVARWFTRSDTHRPPTLVAALMWTNAVLVVGLVVVSIRRLDFYEAQFGATMLRTMSTIGAAWMGVVTIVVAAASTHTQWLRTRLVAATTGVTIVTLVGIAAYDPEVRVAEHNVDRFEAGAELDLDYLAGLSPDAWVVLIDRIDPELVEAELGDGRTLCSDDPDPGWFDFNARDHAVDDWWEDLCAGYFPRFRD